MTGATDQLPDDLLTTVDVAVVTGATYRQLDYWVKRGYVQPSEVAASGIGWSARRPVDRPTSNPGSGRRRMWHPDEAAVAARMVRLLAAGLSVEAAARVARRPDELLELAPGVQVLVTGDPR